MLPAETNCGLIAAYPVINSGVSSHVYDAMDLTCPGVVRFSSLIAGAFVVGRRNTSIYDPAGTLTGAAVAAISRHPVALNTPDPPASLVAADALDEKSNSPHSTVPVPVLWQWNRTARRNIGALIFTGEA